MYDGYPQSILDLQIRERNKILALGKEVSRRESVLTALQQKLTEVSCVLLFVCVLILITDEWIACITLIFAIYTCRIIWYSLLMCFVLSLPFVRWRVTMRRG